MAKFTAISAILLILAASANAASIYETAKAAGLTTLVAAIDAVGLKDTLNDEKLKATVFAPTNEAFAALLKAANLTAGDLLANKDLVTNVLKYHVIGGKALFKKNLADVSSWQTLLPKAQLTLVASPRNSKLKVYYGKLTQKTPASLNYDGKATVVKSDVKAGAAVVHVIDSVLIPASK